MRGGIAGAGVLGLVAVDVAVRVRLQHCREEQANLGLGAEVDRRLDRGIGGLARTHAADAVAARRQRDGQRAVVPGPYAEQLPARRADARGERAAYCGAVSRARVLLGIARADGVVASRGGVSSSK